MELDSRTKDFIAELVADNDVFEAARYLAALFGRHDIEARYARLIVTTETNGRIEANDRREAEQLLNNLLSAIERNCSADDWRIVTDLLRP